MARTGTQPRSSTLKQQRENAELELIIEEFGRCMRQANRHYVIEPSSCHHDTAPRFTPGMQMAWNRYVEFCMKHPNE